MTQAQTEQATTETRETHFLDHVRSLIDVQRRVGLPGASALEISREREKALADALRDLALDHGVTLKAPLQINSNGEFSIVSMPTDGRDPRYGTGSFGDFTEVLNQFNPRCGVVAGSTLAPENGWCYLNHFDAERLVMSAYALTSDSAKPGKVDQADQAAPAERPRS